MAQFDVYRNPDPDSSALIPYLLDIQADTFEPLATRLVVPLLVKSVGGRLLARLNPEATVEGHGVFLSIPELAGIPARSLGEKVSSLAQMRAEIIAGIDFLITEA